MKIFSISCQKCQFQDLRINIKGKDEIFFTCFRCGYESATVNGGKYFEVMARPKKGIMSITG